MGGDLTNPECRFSMNNPFPDDIGDSIMSTQWLKGKWGGRIRPETTAETGGDRGCLPVIGRIMLARPSRFEPAWND